MLGLFILIVLMLVVLFAAAICARMQYDCTVRIARSLLIWRQELVGMVADRWLSKGLADDMWRRMLRRHVPELLETMRSLTAGLSADQRTARSANKIASTSTEALALDEAGQRILAEEISAAADSRVRSLPDRL